MKSDNDWLAWLGLSSTPNFTRSRAFGSFVGFLLQLLILAVVIGVIAALIEFLKAAFHLGIYTDGKEVDDAIRNIGLVLAAAFGAPFIAWRSYVAHKQTAISEESHITDQINKAVAGLGAEKNVKLEDGNETTRPNIEVRVGAIYALERIAQDSDRDHVQIMEILTAYVRENSPDSTCETMTDESGEEMLKWSPIRHPANPEAIETHYSKALSRFGSRYYYSSAWSWFQSLNPKTDIQAAIQVLGRRSANQRGIELLDTRYGSSGYKLNLSNCNLQGVNLTNLDLSGAQCSWCHFEGATLSGTNFTDANLEGSNFSGAELREASLERVDLSWAVMESSNLDHANLRNANMEKIEANGASFIDACLIGSNLSKASLEFSALLDTSLDKSTCLRLATLHGTEARHLDLRDSPLDSKQLAQLFGDGSVLLSKKTKRPNLWPHATFHHEDFDKELASWRSNPASYIPPEKPS